MAKEENPKYPPPTETVLPMLGFKDANFAKLIKNEEINMMFAANIVDSTDAYIMSKFNSEAVADINDKVQKVKRQWGRMKRECIDRLGDLKRFYEDTAVQFSKSEKQKQYVSTLHQMHAGAPVDQWNFECRYAYNLFNHMMVGCTQLNPVNIGGGKGWWHTNFQYRFIDAAFTDSYEQICLQRRYKNDTDICFTTTDPIPAEIGALETAEAGNVDQVEIKKERLAKKGAAMLSNFDGKYEDFIIPLLIPSALNCSIYCVKRVWEDAWLLVQLQECSAHPSIVSQDILFNLLLDDCAAMLAVKKLLMDVASYVSEF